MSPTRSPASSSAKSSAKSSLKSTAKSSAKSSDVDMDDSDRDPDFDVEMLHLRRSQEERLRSFFYLSMKSNTLLTGTGRMAFSMTGPEVTTRVIRGR